MPVNWNAVAGSLRARAERHGKDLDSGQRATLRFAAERLPTRGFVIADEVGMGKTRIACAVGREVIANGGRVAFVVPPGLMHQWKAEWAEVGDGAKSGASPKEMGTFRSFVREVADEVRKGMGDGAQIDEAQLAKVLERRFPQPEAGEAWILSHQLRPPGVRVGERYPHSPWWLAVPALTVQAKASSDSELMQSTAFRRLRRGLEERTEGAQALEWRVARAVASAAAKRIDARTKAWKDMVDLDVPDLRPHADNQKLARSFRKDGKAYAAFQAILRAFLGRFDLVVIDEAHKSRGFALDDEPTTPKVAQMTVLTRLLEAMIDQGDDGRRIGMTATPLELGASQWEALLQRTLRVGSRPPGDEVQKAVQAAQGLENVVRAVRASMRATDGAVSNELVEELCTAGRAVTEHLGPFVTRRTRASEDVFRKYREAIREREPDAQESHGSRLHRRHRPEEVTLGEGAESTNETSRAWIDAIFAMESLGLALRGYNDRHGKTGDEDDEGAASHAFRTQYTRLAGGHLGEDPEEALRRFVEGLPDPGDDVARRRHRARIVYWANQEAKAMQRLQAAGAFTSGKIDPLVEHPRIRKAVEVIEGHAHPGGDGAKASSEREKVLVFGTFLRPMQVLAKVLDARAMLRLILAGRPVPNEPASFLDLAWYEWTHHRPASAPQERFASREELKRSATDAHKRYKAEQARVSETVRAVVDRRLEGLSVPNPKRVRDRVAKLLWPSVIDRWLYDPAAGALPLDKGQIELLAKQGLEVEVLPRVVEREEGDGGRAEDDTADDRWERLVDGLADEIDARHDTHFVRELNGSSPIATRKHLQARFNRPGLAPFVLIAQSQVGREGLNLHEACRVVVQFNAEWNPGVLEQQVGRVDRKNSRWERMAEAWLENPSVDDPPKIEVHSIVLRGTYDDFHWETVMARQFVFDATLFGDLLPADRLANLDPESQRKLAEAAPDFSPERRARRIGDVG